MKIFHNYNSRSSKLFFLAVMLFLGAYSLPLSVNAFYEKQVTVERSIRFIAGGDSVRALEHTYELCTSDNVHPGGGQALISVLHNIGLAQDKLMLDAGDSVNFTHTHEAPFYMNQTGGAWATPYGTWCDSIGNKCGGGQTWSYNARPNTLQIQNIKFTGKRMIDNDITLISSNPAVLSCSGLNCRGLSTGTAEVTAHIRAPQLRVWADWRLTQARSSACGAPIPVQGGGIEIASPPGMGDWGSGINAGVPISKSDYIKLFKNEIEKVESLIDTSSDVPTANNTNAGDSSERSAIAELQLSEEFRHFSNDGWNNQDNNQLREWRGNWRPNFLRDEAQQALITWLSEGKIKPLASYLNTYLPDTLTLYSAPVSGDDNTRGSFFLMPADIGPWTITVRAPDVTITATKDIANGGSFFKKIFSFASRVFGSLFAGGSITVNDGDNVTLNWNVRNAAFCTPVMDPTGTVSSFPEWETGNLNPLGGLLSGVGPLSEGGVYAFGIACRNTFGIEDYDLARVSVEGEIIPPLSCNNNGVKDLVTENCDGADLDGATCPVGFTGSPTCVDCTQVYASCEPPTDGDDDDPPPGGGGTAQCNNNKDDDRDGLIDKNDPGCWKNPPDSASYQSTDNDENNCGNRICESFTGENPVSCRPDCAVEGVIEN